MLNYLWKYIIKFDTTFYIILQGDDFLKNIITFGCIISLLIFILTGCKTGELKNQQPNNAESKIATKYLKDKNYIIVSNEGKVDEYILEKEDLLKLPYQMYWGIQNIDVSKFLKKNIKTFKFIVKEHNNDKTQTIVWVMISDNNVAGGYSVPFNKNSVKGNVYSIDGKTLEEITGMTFQDWREQWVNKYK